MLNFTEFRNTICFGCNLCNPDKLDYSTSSFCFEAYKKDPGLFISFSYQRLRSVLSWPVAYVKEKELFHDVFCKSGTCGKLNGFVCKSLPICLNLHSAQMRSYGAQQFFTEDLKFSVRVPMATIIAGGSDEWVNTVKKME